ncbi:MAG: hypothetical protein GX949_03670 [Peptococcaceae bacterium]|jgi:hypothetical protein|nr:hypothetical protein [Peptococcaceae bacterium]
MNIIISETAKELVRNNIDDITVDLITIDGYTEPYVSRDKPSKLIINDYNIFNVDNTNIYIHKNLVSSKDGITITKANDFRITSKLQVEGLIYEQLF